LDSLRNIPPDEIHIYQTNLDKSPAEINNFKKLMSVDELQKAARFKFDIDRNNYITGRGFLRTILSQYLNTSPEDIMFSYAEKGKPYVKDIEIKFNLSHSKNYAVYAIALNTEVGIDIEYLKNIPDAYDISERFFSEEEREELKKMNEDRISLAFLNCWTRKEAFIKAVGEGLSYPLADFSVSISPGSEPGILWIKKNINEVKEWTLYNIKTDQSYISSVAVKSTGKKIVYRDING
jgi:4'-phosphopantetheinyl transferase